MGAKLLNHPVSIDFLKLSQTLFFLEGHRYIPGSPVHLHNTNICSVSVVGLYPIAISGIGPAGSSMEERSPVLGTFLCV